MPLTRLIYASRAVEALKAEDVESILAASRSNNAKVGVTGVLVYGAREFLQCLEGSREAVNATYARILRDPRHGEVTILDFAEIDRREFAHWAMHHVPPVWSARQHLLRYFEREAFTPLKMSAASARSLLLDLARDAAQSTERKAVAITAPTLGRD